MDFRGYLLIYVTVPCSSTYCKTSKEENVFVVVRVEYEKEYGMIIKGNDFGGMSTWGIVGGLRKRVS